MNAWVYVCMHVGGYVCISIIHLRTYIHMSWSLDMEGSFGEAHGERRSLQ